VGVEPEHVDDDPGRLIIGGRRGRRLAAALIDERAISQAEHCCLYLKAAAAKRITFVGTPTNGTNGDMTRSVLPGGIPFGFTGHDVRFPDDSQLQRRGIQPDILVAPTIAGLRAGRDEVLERAVQFLEWGR